MRGARIARAVLLAAALCPARARCAEPVGPPRWEVTGSLVGGLPQGEFGDNTGASFGARVVGLLRLDRAGAVALRGEACALAYGHESQFVSYGGSSSGYFEQLQITNSVAMFNLGPQLRLPGGRLRPHLDAGLGLARFFTSLSLGGGQYGSETALSDVAFEWGAGGGLAWEVSGGDHPVSLDLSVDYRHHGRVQYLPKGGAVADTLGNLSLPAPVESAASLVLVSLGVTVGLR